MGIIPQRRGFFSLESVSITHTSTPLENGQYNLLPRPMTCCADRDPDAIAVARGKHLMSYDFTHIILLAPNFPPASGAALAWMHGDGRRRPVVVPVQEPQLMACCGLRCHLSATDTAGQMIRESFPVVGVSRTVPITEKAALVVDAPPCSPLDLREMRTRAEVLL